MTKFPTNEEIGIKCGRVDQACARYNFGKNYMRKIAKEANAVVRYGRCFLINFSVMDSYIDSLTR